MKHATPSDEMLMAYADGELDSDSAEAVARAAANNSQVAARIQAFRASRQAAREAFADVLTETPPVRLLATLRTGASPMGDGATVVTLPPRRRLPMTMLPLAAAVVLAAALGISLTGRNLDELVQQTDANAIAEQLPDLMTGSEVEVTLGEGRAVLRVLGAYRIAGGLCRSFALTSDRTVSSGVGCDKGAGWSVEGMIAEGPPDDSFAPASDRATAAVEQLLDGLGAEGPLGRDEEAALAAAGTE